MQSRSLELNILSNILDRKSNERGRFLVDLQAKYFSELDLQKTYKAVLEDTEVTLEQLQTRDFAQTLIADLMMGEIVTDSVLMNLISELKRLTQERILLKMSDSIPRWIENEDIGVVIDDIEKVVSGVSKIGGRDLGTMSEAYKQYIRDKKNVSAMYSDIPTLDRKSGGLRRSQVWVLGADPGVGKSLFALDFALKQAMLNSNVMFLSTELKTSVNLDRLGKMMMFYDGIEDHEEAVERVAGMHNLRLYDSLHSRSELEIEIKRRNEIDGVDLVIIDHLQEIQGDPGQSQYETLNSVCTTVNDLALSLNTRFLLISQLKRSANGKEEFRFLGSSKIEQIAHLAAVLIKSEGDSIILSVQKNRGTVDNPYVGLCDITVEITEFLTYIQEDRSVQIEDIVNL